MTNLKKITDAELTPLVKRGIKQAYQELFERFAPRIFQFSRTYLKNDADSEELVQDVFLKIWEKREKLDSSKNIKAFIFKITVNTIYDFIRRKNLEQAFHDFSRSQEGSPAPNTWHEVIWNEMLENLDELVAQMPDQRRRVFRLSRKEGLSNEEIARQLNLSRRTVENQLYRATAFLKKHFYSDGFISLLFFYLWCG